ncbi:MAG: MoxR family ATPase [Clostridia bacterium]|nr:MoxR family ATPase [Clostridia bacterium]
MSKIDIASFASKLKENIGVVIKGKEEVVDKLILSFLCGGHILLEDIPGTGKTTLVKALAKSVDCNFTRVQFTPDLLPSDLTGVNFYNQQEAKFVFRPGPVFTNILLADEINRATPRTQSSLLECMEEHQVTVDGVTRPLAAPFLVVATQNPIEIQGTFPLPEAQLDRFFMKLSMGYPGSEHELAMLQAFTLQSPLATLSSVLTQEEILAAQQQVREVTVSEAVQKYIVAICEATRRDDRIRLGVSPRGSIAFLHAAQAHAAMQGRNHVLPDDVKAVAADVLSHRIICKGHGALQSSDQAKEILAQILNQTRAPIEG